MTARFVARGSVAVTAGLTGLIAGIIPAAGSTASQPVPAPQVSRISDISRALPGQNAEVEEAADPRTGFVYAEWIAARGIGFARSTDGGYRFGTPVLLPRSHGGWIPQSRWLRTVRSMPRS